MILSFAAACGSHLGSPAPATLQQPSPTEVSRSSVIDLLGTTGCNPVGLTITPETDELVLLDARQGVFGSTPPTVPAGGPQHAKDAHAWIDARMPRIAHGFLPDNLAPHLAACELDDAIGVQARSSLAETQFLIELAERHASMLRDDVPEQQRLAAVILDHIRVTAEMPLQLPWPVDARARRVAEFVRDHPAGSAPLSLLAEGSGARVRTLERLFVGETRLMFARWRQRARLLQALHLLAAGESVTSTGTSVGFASTSAFVAMFRANGVARQAVAPATATHGSINPARGIDRLDPGLPGLDR